MTTNLLDLPTELLECIISHAVPEGFETTAVVCRKLHTLCIPLIERHNRLRAHFQRFSYYETDPTRDIRCAFDLITRIAVEPIVARYIRHADFSIDTIALRLQPRDFFPHVELGDRILRFISDSPYLKAAGLDGKSFYNKIEEDIQVPRYSQHAAIFLLTLLPNIETIKLPRRWSQLDAPNALLHAVIEAAQQSPAMISDSPNLAQTSLLKTYQIIANSSKFRLNHAAPFIALPRMRCFKVTKCRNIDVADRKSPSPSKEWYPGPFAEALQSIHLISSHVDATSISQCLQHTPRLRVLYYNHLIRADAGPYSQNWDLCAFVTAVCREAGSHLEKLHVSVSQPISMITSSQAKTRDFKQLDQFEFSLDVASCSMHAAAAASQNTRGADATDAANPQNACRNPAARGRLFLDELVPVSVTHLSLISSGTDQHADTLSMIFRDFAERTASRLPALERLHLVCPYNAREAYKSQCDKVKLEVEKAGVAFHLEPGMGCGYMTWE